MLRALTSFIALLIVLSFAWFYMTKPHPEKQIESKDPLPSNSAAQLESNLANWHLYTSPSGLFSVFFPMIPQNASARGIDPKTQQPKAFSTYFSQATDGTVYMVSVITDSEDSEGDDELNQIIQDMAIANKDNKLREIKKSRFKLWDALDFIIDNGPNHITGKAFKMGKHIIILTAANPNDTFNPKDFDFFVNSFEPKEANEGL